MPVSVPGVLGAVDRRSVLCKACGWGLTRICMVLTVSRETQNTDSDCVYYHTRDGDGVIGFDGCGAIDFKASALVMERIQHGPRLADRYRAILLPGRDPCNIVMRRAVREFDFFYDYVYDTLIVSPKVLDDHRDWIEPSTLGMQAVTVHFGSRERPYFFGNLKHSNSLRKCCWQVSGFAIADRADFHINQTEIGRHEVPLDHEINYCATNQIFSDESDYWRRLPSLHAHVAERLGFSFPHADIINLGVGDTLISRRLFEALWSRPRPKSRVLGMTGSRPLVSVAFEGGGEP